MKKAALFGMGLRAGSAAVAAESRVNCYYDIRKTAEGAEIMVRGTPGSYQWVSLPSSPIRGIHPVGSVLYVVAYDTLYSITTTGIIARLGSIGTNVNAVSMSDNTFQLIIVDGAAGYIFTIATGILSTIVDAHFPNGATTVAFMSSRFIVERAGTREFYVSNSLDGTNWTYLATLPVFGTKEQNNDVLSAVAVFNGVLMLLGASTTEYWQDASLSPQPFQLITGSVQPFGLAAKYSLASSGSRLLYLAVSPQGGLQVVATNGGAPVRVSDSDVEDLLAGWAVTSTLADAVGMAYSVDGHDMYQITFPTANKSLLLDTATGVWSHTQTGLTPARHMAQYATVFNFKVVYSDATTGALYIVSQTSYSDAGTNILRQVTTRHIRNGGNYFSIAEIDLIMDTGAVPEAANYHIMMEVARDQGNTFGSPRSSTIGKVGQYRTPLAKWTRLGRAKDFVLRFSMDEQCPFVIAGVEMG